MTRNKEMNPILLTRIKDSLSLFFLSRYRAAVKRRKWTIRADRSITSRLRGEVSWRGSVQLEIRAKLPARTSEGGGRSIIKSSPWRRANFDPHEFSASAGGGELCSPGGKNKMSGADGVKLPRNLEQPEIPASRHQLRR